CNFYAGYPITPSSEIAQYMSKEMPKRGMPFIQMEDEISSLGACIGASLSGRKVLTATSGPGYSLMQEHIGMAAMTETPLVIVNVMRGGPSTGLPTKPSQADIMQVRWGSHGDYPAIALYPAFSAQIFSETIRAFNLAEKYMTPVTLLLDEVVAKAHETFEMVEPGSYEVVNDRIDKIDGLNIYDRPMGEKPPRIDFFKGYPIHVESLEHNTRGFPTIEPEIVDRMQNLRLQKIKANIDDIVRYEEYYMEDAEIMIFSAGISTRAAIEAAIEARKQGIKAGVFQALTIWPFPEKVLKERFSRIRKVLTVELNMGQMKNEIERIAPDSVEKRTLLKATGVPFTPSLILEALQQFQASNTGCGREHS
ncbi:MAG: 2-oxoacid:acceptor oxidoreductase subunit alpha, partial [Clostridiales bacterium]|nr:2-oxoacid:acceptor oxidoreductase subunit alpha [Clostridiales bacterium]